MVLTKIRLFDIDGVVLNDLECENCAHYDSFIKSYTIFDKFCVLNLVGYQIFNFEKYIKYPAILPRFSQFYFK